MLLRFSLIKGSFHLLVSKVSIVLIKEMSKRISRQFWETSKFYVKLNKLYFLFNLP